MLLEAAPPRPWLVRRFEDDGVPVDTDVEELFDVPDRASFLLRRDAALRRRSKPAVAGSSFNRLPGEAEGLCSGTSLMWLMDELGELRRKFILDFCCCDASAKTRTMWELRSIR